ncbi:hypothetical protein N836_34065 [Leptolyngbya sp. Heron Island J]|uniref:hypothetical protein n=1 Tax=Leptolyngbya sp. Heron Island J TaxID=1385935 RepID=UPI0003B96707|nr:hypothetical protein [Leptolyngbya sp. Heron Island J]ESA38105.1 hypothetical protein N836_34065 [Leptolyngbya sp. Heron Island J]
MLKLLNVLVAIAQALERQAVAQERIATALETQQLPETGDKELAAKVLGVSVRQVERYHKEWILNVHYSYQGRKPTYNLALLRDWKANKENPTAHQRAIQIWQRSLPSNQKKRA